MGTVQSIVTYLIQVVSTYSLQTEYAVSEFSDSYIYNNFCVHVIDRHCVNSLLKMAQPEKQALKKLEEEITCAICLDPFNDPKLLPCFHVFCVDCLKGLVRGEHGQVYLRCPTCRRLTHLSPDGDLGSLQPAFYIHHLFDIKNALMKVKKPQSVVCQKCTKFTRVATSYCRDCGEFICDVCTGVHFEWKMFEKHEVIPLNAFEDKVKQLKALKKVTLYCSLHQGKELELYCETCMEPICHNCTVKKHKDHQYDLVDDVFDKNKDKLRASLKPVQKQIHVISKALQLIDTQSKEVDSQRATIEVEIEKGVMRLQELLKAQKAELISKLNQVSQQKQKNLTMQKEKLETTQGELHRCVSFVGESLKTGSKGEVLKMMKTVTRHIEVIRKGFDPDELSPCEPVNLVFKASSNLTSDCKYIGEVYVEVASAKKCYAIGSGLEVAVQGERTTVVFHSIDNKGNIYNAPLKTLSSELISEKTGERINCSMKKIQINQYEISFQPATQGKHLLHIKVDNQDIDGSPFSLSVFKKPSILAAAMTSVERPCSVTTTGNSRVMITEMEKHCVTIFSQVTREKIGSFGNRLTSRGYFQKPWGWAVDSSSNLFVVDGYFQKPRGLAVDSNNNIIVVDGDNHRIQKLTADGKHVAMVGKEGTQKMQFRYPSGIGIHPHNKRIYVADTCNHRIQVLNSNLTFNCTFGSNGKNNGQLKHPHDVSFDSAGNVYVVDNSNHRIQVFGPSGNFLRHFGKHGIFGGELNYPSAIAVDCNNDNVVYVADKDNHRISMFTSSGKYITSFGEKGSEFGQFDMPHGITVAENGTVYVCDFYNNRVQIFQ